MNETRLRKSSAGKSGEGIRSDCFVVIEAAARGGIRLQLQSKVKSMYGASIEKLVRDMCAFFDLRHARIGIDDNGALPYVIAARVEAAVNRLLRGTEREYLLPMHENNRDRTKRDRWRRSRLYLPGNEPKFFINAGLHLPDAVIIDLEDSVPPAEKDGARFLARNTLRVVDFYGAERMVRINQGQRGLDDLRFIVPHNPHALLIPKAESPRQIVEVEKEVARLAKAHGVAPEILFIPIVESALGVMNAYAIATASSHNVALAIGLEDYTADLGVQRTKEGTESFFARSMVVNAARAAGLQALDTVFSDVNDMDGLRQSALEARALGFEGKGCIHPRQIDIVHQAFAPSPEEIAKAVGIVRAFEEAERRGSGVVALDGKMIDAPVVKRAQKIVDLALLTNRLSRS